MINHGSSFKVEFLDFFSLKTLYHLIAQHIQSTVKRVRRVDNHWRNHLHHVSVFLAWLALRLVSWVASFLDALFLATMAFVRVHVLLMAESA